MGGAVMTADPSPPTRSLDELKRYFSPSVRKAIDRLKAGAARPHQVTPVGFLKALADVHPEYADDRLGKLRGVDTHQGTPMPLAGLLERILALYDVDELHKQNAVLHTRTVVIDLATLDETVHHEVGSDLHHTLEDEKKPEEDAANKARRALDTDRQTGAGEDRTYVPWSTDEAIGVDHDVLSRVPVARALATQLAALHRRFPGGSFLVHIDGPWGAGKSTLLRFLREIIDDGDGDDGPEPWLVVSFDAWRQSRSEPAWLMLLQAVRSAVGGAQRSWRGRARFWVGERLRLVSPWQWIALSLMTIVALVLLAMLARWRPDVTAPEVDGLLKLVSGVVTLAASLWLIAKTVSRWAMLGSQRSATAFEQTHPDPMEELAGHFAWILDQTDRTVLVLIDDLDRCDHGYVVELLDTVQKLMRDRDVRPRRRQGRGGRGDPSLFFVVAADGRWVRQSYDATHGTLADVVREPGRSLGSLFVEKLFQLTVPVPRLSEALKRDYLTQLLQDEVTDGRPNADPALVERLRAAPRSEVLGVLSTVSTLERVGVAGVAIERMVTEPGAEEATRHILEPYAPLLEPNPRAMKRFVIAFSMLRSVRTAEGSVVGDGPLALWTVLRSRWPMLAEHLEQDPDAVQWFQLPADQLSSAIPATLVPLFTDPPPELRAVVNHQDGPLDAATIRQCAGLMAGQPTTTDAPSSPTAARADDTPDGAAPPHPAIVGHASPLTNERVTARAVGRA